MLRTLLAIAILGLAGGACAAEKVLRYAFEIAETSFDPHRIADVYSNIVNQAMFEAPLTYDYLAKPAKLKPNLATAMPEVSADGTTYTVRIKPGIFFADDPAFDGKKRELVAADFLYSMKRLLDPKVRASQAAELEPYVVGADEAAERARKTGKFDYDATVEGLKAVDRYTFQVKIKKPMYVFIYRFADCRIACAVAREVAEKYGEDFGAHPVGTGPFRLAFWKRSSKMVFERNPNYHDDRWDAQVPAGDPRTAEFEAMRGKRLPMIDRVEVSIIEETQPRWLSFLNEEMDLIFLVPDEFAYKAFPNNKLAKNLERRGIRMEQFATLDVTYAFYNMEDPVFGGYTPEKVALRRAINLSYKIEDEIAILRKGQAVPAQGPFAPGVAGYDPDFRTAANEYNPAKAKALLDMFGYVDRDGDGYRERPDGSPLTLQRSSAPSSRDQQFDELWKRSLDDIGVRLSIRKAKWPDLLKESNAGKLMMWALGGSASAPDADTWLQIFYGPNAGFKGNRSRFKHAEYDRLYEKAKVMPDSPERTKLYQEMTKIVVAFAPYKINTHRILTDMWYPHVIGFRRPPVQTQNWWKYVDIDLQRVAGR